MPRKTQIPKDFQVTDGLRDYSVRKWSLLFLPDVMLADFQHCFDKELGGNGYVHDNWETTFKRYMREASPEGTMYKPNHWETRAEQAKRHKLPVIHSQVTKRNSVGSDSDRRGHERTTFIPANEVGTKALKQMRDLLQPYEDLLK